ncbi:MAG: peptide-methionine (S)-S-oxide reductase [Deinococcota bacterium]|nr:peptide-methionine (S)-S-oxide reductase [Deinococcota bacterium]
MRPSAPGHGRRESSGNYSAPIVTDIRPATTFWPAQEYHQRYIRKGGDHACNVYNRNVKIPEHLKQSAS